MTPIYQEPHQCLSACAASILDISLSECFTYDLHSYAWTEAVDEWGKDNGVVFVCDDWENSRLYNFFWHQHIIGVVQYEDNPRCHAVVCKDNKIVHNPAKNDRSSLARLENLLAHCIIVAHKTNWYIRKLAMLLKDEKTLYAGFNDLTFKG